MKKSKQLKLELSSANGALSSELRDMMTDLFRENFQKFKTDFIDNVHVDNNGDLAW